MPLIAFHDNKLLTQCSRYPFTGFGSFVRNPALPPITTAQIEALNAVHFISQRNAIILPNVKGDILYVNNMSMLHGRYAMKDRGGSEVLSGRHRLKFFLRDPQRAWKIPVCFERVWTDVYGPNMPDGMKKEGWILQPDKSVSFRWKING
jgi:hypothetical protein